MGQTIQVEISRDGYETQNLEIELQNRNKMEVQMVVKVEPENKSLTLIVCVVIVAVIVVAALVAFGVFLHKNIGKKWWKKAKQEQM